MLNFFSHFIYTTISFALIDYDTYAANKPFSTRIDKDHTLNYTNNHYA